MAIVRPFFLALAFFPFIVSSFSSHTQYHGESSSISRTNIRLYPTFISNLVPQSHTQLFMSDNGGGGGATEKIKKTKKGLSTIVIDKTETKSDQKEDKEEEWRVVLHNDEVHVSLFQSG
jgi:hypothetical protein